MEVDKGLRHILLYGLVMAGLILGLKWLQWNFLIVENAIDLYIGMIAAIFTVLGVWIASQLIQPKTHTVVVEKEIIVHQPKTFVLNQAALESLQLTKREYEILQLIVQGYNNADIANNLFLSLSTIKTHVSNLYSKMNVKNRYKAISLAKKMEIVA
ncbi:MAG: response regulator transcription factor [Maribacter sp.]|uniref:response regulator transcription factor n=1 Tax=Maribacter sp. TaxID=1897614 RepID=UPI003297DFAE